MDTRSSSIPKSKSAQSQNLNGKLNPNEPRGGTTGYRPVELLLPDSNSSHWTEGADIWSVGIIMLSILTRKEHPFRGKGV